MVQHSELAKLIDGLPPRVQKEVVDYVGYLQYKHRLTRCSDVVKLGGIWADIDLDVTDNDVRSLRQQVTRQLVDKVSADGISG